MNRKKWAALTLSLLGLSIGGTVALVVAVDPFEVYHKATAFIPPISNGTQIYSNAGIAKDYRLRQCGHRLVDDGKLSSQPVRPPFRRAVCQSFASTRVPPLTISR